MMKMSFTSCDLRCHVLYTLVVAAIAFVLCMEELTESATFPFRVLYQLIVSNENFSSAILRKVKYVQHAELPVRKASRKGNLFRFQSLHLCSRVDGFNRMSHRNYIRDIPPEMGPKWKRQRQPGIFPNPGCAPILVGFLIHMIQDFQGPILK